VESRVNITLSDMPKNAIAVKHSTFGLEKQGACKYNYLN